MAPSPASFLRIPPEFASTFSSEDIALFQERCVFPGCDVRLVPCDPSVRANYSDDHSIVVFRDHLRLGLRFPLCFELLELLRYYGVWLAQVMPHSLEGVMTFVLFLRRWGMQWSLGLFGFFFYLRVHADGLVSFVPRSDEIRIVGAGEKLKDWKKFFCLAQSAQPWGLPARPSSQRRKAPREDGEGVAVLRGMILDVRQYAQDPEVLRRLLCPQEFGGMTEALWGVSDEACRVRMDRETAQAPGRARALPSNPASFRLVEETGPAGRAGLQLQILPLPSRAAAAFQISSGTPSASGAPHNPLARVSDSPRGSGDTPGRISRTSPPSSPPVDKAEASSTRARRREGKAAVRAEASSPPDALIPKVFPTADGNFAYVRLAEEWFPPGQVGPGPASSMGTVLHSAAFNERLAHLPWDRIREESASHHAASWRFSEHYARLVEEQWASHEELRQRVGEQGEELAALRRSQEEMSSRLAEADRILGAQQAEAQDREMSLRHDHEMMVQRCRELQREVDAFPEQEYEWARMGTVFCLDQLIRVGKLSARWKDPERLFALAQDRAVRQEGRSGGSVGAGPSRPGREGIVGDAAGEGEDESVPRED